MFELIVGSSVILSFNLVRSSVLSSFFEVLERSAPSLLVKTFSTLKQIFLKKGKCGP